jgi:hypothetical protein
VTGNGEQFVRTIVKTAMPGISSRMIMPDHGPIAGVKMVLPAFPMISSILCFAWLFGMARIQYSRSGISD